MILELEKKLKSIGFEPKRQSIKAIAKGGSMRSFFRFKDDKNSYIFCEYSPEKEENFLYADIAKFLKSSSVNVCDIAYENKELHTLVMSDLGEIDLLDFSKTCSLKAKEKVYKNAIKEAFKIHTIATKNFEKDPIKLMSGFDKTLYTWEQNYFYENLIYQHFNLGVKAPYSEWQSLQKEFLNSSQCLLHRDFQSQNVIVNPETLDTHLIDFQGMRLGVCWYDLGSVLFDPYANIESEFSYELFKYYCELSNEDSEIKKDIFFKLSSQRLMQALGAFAFLANKKGKLEYLDYIRPALKNLIFCTQNCGLKNTLFLAKLALEKLESKT